MVIRDCTCLSVRRAIDTAIPVASGRTRQLSANALLPPAGGEDNNMWSLVVPRTHRKDHAKHTATYQQSGAHEAPVHW
jgi:hypothetical protein